jgi:hypothetical protein
VSAPGRRLFSDLGERVVRMSSSLVAASAIAILSTASLCGLGGTAASQTTPTSTLPGVTVTAPEQKARPPRRVERVANTGAGRRAARAARTPAQTEARTPLYAPGSTMAKLAALERTASSCNDGCETSFKRGNAPWVGCSTSAGFRGTFSATCTDTITHRDYVQCAETKMFTGWDRQRAWWYCTSLMIAGRFRVTEANRYR